MSKIEATDRISTVQIVAWLIILAGVVFSAGVSFATLSAVKEAIAEIKPEVIKHGKEISALKAVIDLGDK